MHYLNESDMAAQNSGNSIKFRLGLQNGFGIKQEVIIFIF
jgi:hypothetical protein